MRQIIIGDVDCRFIPSHHFYNHRYKYEGYRFDEVFGFPEHERIQLVRNPEERYKGSWVDYIIDNLGGK